MTRPARGAPAVAPGIAGAGIATAWATVVLTVAATAGTIPDAAQLSKLRMAAAKAPLLLVHGDFGVRELRKPLLDSTGVRPTKWNSGPHATPEGKTVHVQGEYATGEPIAWSDISSLETQHQQKTKWALMGGITGLAVGALMFGLTDSTAETGSWEGVGWVVGAPMVGVMAGFIVGSMTGKRTIYPQPLQGNP